MGWRSLLPRASRGAGQASSHPEVSLWKRVSLLTGMLTVLFPSVTGLTVPSIFRVNKGRESEFTSRRHHGQESGTCYHCRKLWVRTKSQALLRELGGHPTKAAAAGPWATVGLSASIHPLAFIIQTHSAAPRAPKILICHSANSKFISSSLELVKGQRRLLGLIKFSFCPSMDLRSEARSVVFDSVTPTNYTDSPGQNTGVGSLSLLQGIFPTQGSNPGLHHCRWIFFTS